MSTTNRWPTVTTLTAGISSETTELNGVIPHMQCLSDNMAALRGSLPAGNLLNQQLSDISRLLQTVQDIFEFLDDIKALDGVFNGAQTTIATQQKQVAAITAKLEALNKTVANIGTTVAAAEKMHPVPPPLILRLIR